MTCLTFASLEVSNKWHTLLFTCIVWMRTQHGHGQTHVERIRIIPVLQQKICAINICIATAILPALVSGSCNQPALGNLNTFASGIVSWQWQRAGGGGGGTKDEPWAAKLVGNDAYENFYVSCTEHLYLKRLKRHLTSTQPIWLIAAQWVKTINWP